MLRRVPLLFLALTGCVVGAGAPETLTVQIGGLAAVESALGERRGDACLLNFWATWCPPCVAELPDLAEVASAYASQGGRVLGVSYDLMIPGVERGEVEGKVRKFLEAREILLPTVILEAPDFDAIDARFELPGAIPVTLAYDRQGKLVDRHEGEASRERFEEMMRKALGI